MTLSLLKAAQDIKTTLSLEIDVNDKHCLSGPPKRIALKENMKTSNLVFSLFRSVFNNSPHLLLYFVVYGGDLRGRGGSVKRP